MRRIGSATNWLGQVASWVVILGISAVLLAVVLVPRIGGATPYTILTSSMEPSYPPGTMVVMKPKPIAQIGVGEVITYQLESGKEAVVTHRVTGIAVGNDGERRFTTQGDANDTPDRERVRPVQIKGTLWYSVPRLGYVNNMLTGSERQMAVYVVASLLLGYAGFMLASSFRDSRGKRRISRDGPS